MKVFRRWLERRRHRGYVRCAECESHLIHFVWVGAESADAPGTRDVQALCSIHGYFWLGTYKVQLRPARVLTRAEVDGIADEFLASIRERAAR